VSQLPPLHWKSFPAPSARRHGTEVFDWHDSLDETPHCSPLKERKNALVHPSDGKKSTRAKPPALVAVDRWQASSHTTAAAARLGFDIDRARAFTKMLRFLRLTTEQGDRSGRFPTAVVRTPGGDGFRSSAAAGFPASVSTPLRSVAALRTP
jgi:hypothetical protein